MLSRYSGEKLRNLRRRAMLTQIRVVELTGIAESTLYYLEHGKRRIQTGTLEKLLNLYALRISRLERMERLWGEDGLQSNTDAGTPGAGAAAGSGGSIQPPGMAHGHGAQNGNHQPRPASVAPGGRIQDHARPGPQSPFYAFQKKETHR